MGEVAANDNLPAAAAWVRRVNQSGLLKALSDRDWRTLSALLIFADNTGRCRVDLEALAQSLGSEQQEAHDRLGDLLEQRFHAQPLVRMVKDSASDGAGQLTIWLSGWVWDRSGEVDDERDLRPVYQFAERVFNRPLANAEILAVRQWQEQYGFSREVIIELLEECYTKGKKRLSYMNAVARNWYDDGVRTLEDLNRRREDDHESLGRHARIIKYLGLGRNLTQPEKTYLHKWTWEWGFSDEVILRACDLTVNASRPSFSYIDRILGSWRLRGVRNVEDAERLLAERVAEREKAGRTGRQQAPRPQTSGLAAGSPTRPPATGLPVGGRRKYDDLIRG